MTRASRFAVQPFRNGPEVHVEGLACIPKRCSNGLSSARRWPLKIRPLIRGGTHGNFAISQKLRRLSAPAVPPDNAVLDGVELGKTRGRYAFRGAQHFVDVRRWQRRRRYRAHFKVVALGVLLKAERLPGKPSTDQRNRANRFRIRLSIRSTNAVGKDGRPNDACNRTNHSDCAIRSPKSSDSRGAIGTGWQVIDGIDFFQPDLRRTPRTASESSTASMRSQVTVPDSFTCALQLRPDHFGIVFRNHLVFTPGFFARSTACGTPSDLARLV